MYYTNRSARRKNNDDDNNNTVSHTVYLFGLYVVKSVKEIRVSVSHTVVFLSRF